MVREHNLEPDDLEQDDLEVFIDKELEDPAFRAAYEDVSHRNQVVRCLIQRRKARRVSQATVAARMGTTQSAVSDIESGETDPRVSTLQRYARAIGCSIDILVKDDEIFWQSGPGEESIEIRPVRLINRYTEPKTRVLDIAKTRITVADSAGQSFDLRMA